MNTNADALQRNSSRRSARDAATPGAAWRVGAEWAGESLRRPSHSAPLRMVQPQARPCDANGQPNGLPFERGEHRARTAAGVTWTSNVNASANQRERERKHERHRERHLEQRRVGQVGQMGLLLDTLSSVDGMTAPEPSPPTVEVFRTRFRNSFEAGCNRSETRCGATDLRETEQGTGHRSVSSAARSGPERAPAARSGPAPAPHGARAGWT